MGVNAQRHNRAQLRSNDNCKLVIIINERVYPFANVAIKRNSTPRTSLLLFRAALIAASTLFIFGRSSTRENFFFEQPALSIFAGLSERTNLF